MVSLPDGRSVLDLLSASVRSIVEEHSDVIRLLLAAAPHDPVAAEGLRRSTANVRAGLEAVAAHLSDRGALRGVVNIERTVDVLFFYFGMTYLLLVVDNGWAPDDAQRWLAEQSASALLQRGHTPR